MKKNLLEEIKLRIKQPVFFEDYVFDEIVACISDTDSLVVYRWDTKSTDIGRIVLHDKEEGKHTVIVYSHWDYAGYDYYYDIPSVEDAKALLISKYKEYIMRNHIHPYFIIEED